MRRCVINLIPLEMKNCLGQMPTKEYLDSWVFCLLLVKWAITDAIFYCKTNTNMKYSFSLQKFRENIARGSQCGKVLKARSRSKIVREINSLVTS